MRVKFKTGNSFSSTSAYVLGATKDQRPRILMLNGIEMELRDGAKINAGKLSRNKIYKIAREIGRSFDVQAACHPLEKPVRHYIMTFPPEDRELLEDSSRMRQIVKEYMAEQGMLNTQYLVVSHNNTDHPHVHIVFNPINNDLEVIKQSAQFKKNEKLCKELTKKYCLHFSDPRKFKVKDYKKIAKHERDKVFVRSYVEDALICARSVSEFKDILRKKRIIVEGKYLEKDEKKCLEGLIFHFLAAKNKVRHYKSTQLSRSLTVEVIVKALMNNNAQQDHVVDKEDKTNELSPQSMPQAQPQKPSKKIIREKHIVQSGSFLYIK